MSQNQTQLAGELRAGSGEYNTKLEWVAPISAIVGGFEADVCASSDSDLAETNIRETGGLEADWSRFRTIWCNHPYSNPTPWLRKAVECDAETVVTLSKADMTTDWWRDYLQRADLWCFPNKRMEFIGTPRDPPWPNVFGVFGEYDRELVELFRSWGWTIEASENAENPDGGDN